MSKQFSVDVKDFTLTYVSTARTLAGKKRNTYLINGEIIATFMRFPALARELDMNFMFPYKKAKRVFRTNKLDSNQYVILAEVKAVKIGSSGDKQIFQITMKDMPFEYYHRYNDFMLGINFDDCVIYSDQFKIYVKDAKNVNENCRRHTEEQEQEEEPEPERVVLKFKRPDNVRQAPEEEEIIGPVRSVEEHDDFERGVLNVLIAKSRHRTDPIMKNLGKMLALINVIYQNKLISAIDLQAKLVELNELIKIDDPEVLRVAKELLGSVIQD